MVVHTPTTRTLRRALANAQRRGKVVLYDEANFHTGATDVPNSTMVLIGGPGSGTRFHLDYARGKNIALELQPTVRLRKVRFCQAHLPTCQHQSAPDHTDSCTNPSERLRRNLGGWRAMLAIDARRALGRDSLHTAKAHLATWVFADPRCLAALHRVLTEMFPSCNGLRGDHLERKGHWRLTTPEVVRLQAALGKGPDGQYFIRVRLSRGTTHTLV